MEDQEIALRQKLREYVDTVRSTTALDKVQAHCIDLLRSLPGTQLADIEVENEAHESRVYALLGNLIFDFERNIHWQSKDLEGHLKHYISYLRLQSPQTKYVVITTDGLSFHVYMPRYDKTDELVELEKIFGLNLASPMMTPERVMRDLGFVLGDVPLDTRNHLC